MRLLTATPSVCNDLNWFDNFSRVSEYDVHAPDNPETRRQVQGIGHVTLTVVRNFNTEGKPSAHGKVMVRDVLYVPRAPVNILSARPAPSSSSPLLLLQGAMPTRWRPISGTIRFVKPDTPPVVAFIRKAHWSDYDRVWLSPPPEGPPLAKSILPDGLTLKLLGCVGTVDNFNAAIQNRDKVQLQRTKRHLEDLGINSYEYKIFEMEEAHELSEEQRVWLKSRVCRSWAGFISYLSLQGKPFESRYESLLSVMEAVRECDKQRTDTKKMLKKTYLRVNEELAKKHGDDECLIEDKVKDKAETTVPPPPAPAPRKRRFTVSTPDEGGVSRETMREKLLQDGLGDNITSGIGSSDKNPIKVDEAVGEIDEDKNDGNDRAVHVFDFHGERPEEIGRIRGQVSTAAQTSPSPPDILRLNKIPKGLKKRKCDALSDPHSEDSTDDEQLRWLPSPGRWEDRESPNSNTMPNIPRPPVLPPPTAAALAEMALKPDLGHPELFVDLRYPYYYKPGWDSQRW